MKADYLNDVTGMEESVPAVLMRVVTELHDVAFLIERIEPQLAELHPEEGENTIQRMMVLQGIDLAVQKARGLAEFLGQVTADMPKGWAVDVTTALNLVKLSDMKSALGNGALQTARSQPLADTLGDFEAF